MSLACYVLLLMPSRILGSPLFAILCFSVGYGPAPLLLVIITPFLTEHVSTALGLHKALEMAGSTLMQTVSDRLETTDNSMLAFYSILKPRISMIQQRL